MSAAQCSAAATARQRVRVLLVAFPGPGPLEPPISRLRWDIERTGEHVVAFTYIAGRSAGMLSDLLRNCDLVICWDSVTGTTAAVSRERVAALLAARRHRS